MATAQLVSTVLKFVPDFFRTNRVTHLYTTTPRKQKGDLLPLHLSALPVAHSVLLHMVYVG